MARKNSLFVPGIWIVNIMSPDRLTCFGNYSPTNFKLPTSGSMNTSSHLPERSSSTFISKFLYKAFLELDGKT